MKQNHYACAVSIIAVTVMFSGCASTQYVERKGNFWGSGHYESKIQDDVFKVGYTGVASTMRDQAEDLALLRCADVTLNNGYTHFVVQDKNTTSYTHSSYTPLMPYDYKGATYYTGGYSSTYSNPDIYFVIRCFHGKPLDLDASQTVYDAADVRANLRERYKLDLAKTGLESVDAKAEKISHPASEIKTSPKTTSLSAGIDSSDKEEVGRAFESALN